MNVGIKEVGQSTVKKYKMQHLIVDTCRPLRCVSGPNEINVPPALRSLEFLLVPFHRLAGLVVTASASTAEDPGFESRLRRDFSGVESYQ